MKDWKIDQKRNKSTIIPDDGIINTKIISLKLPTMTVLTY